MMSNLTCSDFNSQAQCSPYDLEVSVPTLENKTTALSKRMDLEIQSYVKEIIRKKMWALSLDYKGHQTVSQIRFPCRS